MVGRHFQTKCSNDWDDRKRQNSMARAEWINLAKRSKKTKFQNTTRTMCRRMLEHLRATDGLSRNNRVKCATIQWKKERLTDHGPKNLIGTSTDI